MANNMRVYLAAPFFNPQQLARVMAVEALLDKLKIDYYSPRKSGIVLKDLPPEKRMAVSDQVFDENVTRLMWGNTLLAIVDDKDTGTTWELGFTYGINQAEWGKEKIIITFSENSAFLNVMLAKCCDAHAAGLMQLTKILQYMLETGMVPPTKQPESAT